MAGETQVTVIGNLVADPELRFTPSGAAVSNFRVASTPRKFNSTTNAWEDGEAMFLSCAIWRQPAEHVAESLRKGDRVIVVGRLKQRSWEDKDGQKRTVFECDVEEVGPSLKFREISHSSQRAASRSQAADPEDPWAAPPQSDEPPFRRGSGWLPEDKEPPHVLESRTWIITTYASSSGRNGMRRAGV